MSAYVLVEGASVLRVAVVDLADRGDPEPDQVAVGVRGVALKVAVKAAVLLRHGQLVVGSGEVIHADIDIPGFGQPLARGLEDIQLGPGQRQIRLVDAPLRHEALGQMGVVEDGQPVWRELDDAVQGAQKSLHRLKREAVDEIDADGTEALGAGRLQHRQGLLLCLNPVDRLLHRGIEILYTQAHAVETQAPQQGDGVRIRLPRIDLDRVLARVVVGQSEPTLGTSMSAAIWSRLMKVGVPPPQWSCSTCRSAPNKALCISNSR